MWVYRRVGEYSERPYVRLTATARRTSSTQAVNVHGPVRANSIDRVAVEWIVGCKSLYNSLRKATM